IVASDRALELVLAADAEPVQPGEAFTYTLTYGHTATSAVVPDTLLELPLPDGVSFVSATAGGTLGGDIVQWNLSTLDPGQIGRVQVTVAVDASTALGSLLQTQAVLASTSQADMIARTDTVTPVEAESTLLLSAAVRPEPVEAGEYLDVALTVSNTSTFERSDVVLWFRYPEHLDSLANSVISGGASISNAIGSYTSADFREFVSWNLGTLEAGTSKTVTLPPMVTAGTPAGTVIEIRPQVSDSSGTKTMVSRCIAVEDERIFELVLNTDMDAAQPEGLLTYTLSYGHRATSASVSDAVLSLPLPDDVSFVSATGSGTLSNGTVQWSLGTLEPGQVSRKQVTVRVDSATGFGVLLETQAVLTSAGQPDIIARADAATKVVETMPLLLSMGVTPDPAGAGDKLDGSLTVTNTCTFDRSDVVLTLRYPQHLNSLNNSLISDGASISNAIGSYTSADFREFVTWNLDTLAAGSEKTVTLPPTVQTATIDGTIIDFDAVVSDATARSRVEHTVLIGQLASEIEYHVLTVEVDGDGSVTSDPAGISCPENCTETFPSGAQVTLTAVPDNSWEFKEWTGDCTGTDPDCVVTMSEDLQVGATFVAQEINQKCYVLTNGTPRTLASGNDTIVYGCHGANHIVLENGAVARLINFPGGNTITIQSDSSLFTVSRSGTSVTFTGSGGTILVIPATTTAQSIVFNDDSFELKIDSGSVMLGNQVISAERAVIAIK
ncbi:MAG: DUF11 domain-containing protein, partial [Desulfobacteraceae bacterium]|nr:DUF11 domain-containing protein [Desulfobacteraceae bacterium]